MDDDCKDTTMDKIIMLTTSVAPQGTSTEKKKNHSSIGHRIFHDCFFNEKEQRVIEWCCIFMTTNMFQ